jgi:hypothetical protein
VRRPSGNGDGAFVRPKTGDSSPAFRAGESGVALRLPPQSKTPNGKQWFLKKRDETEMAFDFQRQRRGIFVVHRLPNESAP